MSSHAPWSIRPTLAADTPFLLGLAEAAGVFKPMELTALAEVLDDYHAANCRIGHQCATAGAGGRIDGFVYYAPAAMTDRTWYLYWIVTARPAQRQGLGSLLLHHAEREIKGAGGRLLLIETSGLPHYEPARSFYRKHGYELHAVVKDFYADGDDLNVFHKRLLPPETQAASAVSRCGSAETRAGSVSDGARPECREDAEAGHGRRD